MSKHKIVIASLLKPVDDTRMFEKFAHSLSKSMDYDISIVGFRSHNHVKHNHIRFFPLFNFKRSSIKRLFAPYKYFKLLLKVKPELIIVNSIDLQLVTYAYKILFGGKIIYDVQENYYRNIRYTDTYPWLVRFPLAAGVRALEWLSRLFVTHYFLAEKNYAKEFSFTKGRSTVIENKYKNTLQHTSKKLKEGNTINLLYSGTIAESHGIFEAIDLVEKLNMVAEKFKLTIIGYCADPSTLLQIENEISANKNITLIGGEELVPHSQIVEKIASADFGLITYHKNKSTEDCFPTKIYEYMAHQLPMIITENPYWVKFCTKHNACISIDYKKIHPKVIFDKLETTSFYTNSANMDIYWESEEEKLLSIIKKILKA